MTEPAGRPRRVWPRKVWVPCVVAGLLLVVAGLALNAGRGDPARASGAVPVVNRGRLAPVLASDPPARRTAAAARHSTPARFVPGSRLRLGRLGLDARIVAVRAVRNVMQIPRDPHTLGWWRGGSAPGAAAGATVIVGHINYAGVTGALAVLPQARPGDVVVVREPHRDQRYRVQAIRTYPKSSGIPADVFSRVGPARLILITCGGPFDASTGNYEDNIVAYADPV